MYQRSTGFEILGPHPLWINDRGNVFLCENQYESGPGRIIVPEPGNTRTFQEFKVCKDVTMVPELGTIFYTSQEAAIRYQSLFESDEGKAEFLRVYRENAIKYGNYVLKIPNAGVPNGIYALKEYEDAVSKNADNVMEIRYLDNSDDPHNSFIKKIHIAEGACDKICRMAFDIWHPPVIDENRPVIFFRLFFEVYNHCGDTYVDVFAMHNKNNWLMINGCHRYTSLNGYPMFYVREEAKRVRYQWQEGWGLYFNVIGEKIARNEGAEKARQHERDIKDAMMTVGRFALDNAGTAIEKGREAIKWFKKMRKNK